MIIASTVGTMIGNLLRRVPFMLIFLMGDYTNALIWASADTIFECIKKYQKKYLTKCA